MSQGHSDKETMKMSSTLPLAWADTIASSRILTASVQALLGFLIAVTLSWNHQMWHMYLWTPFFASVVASFTMVLVPKRWSPVPSAVVAGGLSLVVTLVSASLLATPTLMAVVSVVVGFIIAFMYIPFAKSADVRDAYVVQLRVQSVIAILSVIVYILNDSASSLAITPDKTSFTICLPVAILLGQLVLIRRLQRQSSDDQMSIAMLLGTGAYAAHSARRMVLPIVFLIILLLAFSVVATLLVDLLSPVVPWFKSHLARIIHHMRQEQAHRPTMQPSHLSVPSPPDPTVKWIIWAVLLTILLAITLWWVLSKRNQSAVSQSGQSESAELAPIRVTRDRNIDVFALESTSNPVRLRFQQRLRTLHRKGMTIALSETPREWLTQLPSTEQTSEDSALIDAYERVRYKGENTPE